MTIHPGELLRDELRVRRWTQAEFARMIGRPAQLVSEIITGKKSITAQTAVQFGRALGTSAMLWMTLQAAYDIERAGAIKQQPTGTAEAVIREMRDEQ